MIQNPVFGLMSSVLVHWLMGMLARSRFRSDLLTFESIGEVMAISV